MDYLIRRGQTALILLDYTVNGNSLADTDISDLEFTFGGVSYLLSEDEIFWYSDENSYAVFLNEEATLALPLVASYQLKVLVDEQVGVSDVEYERIGDVLSKTPFESVTPA